MNRADFIKGAAATLAGAAFLPHTAGAASVSTPIVFFDIAGPDLAGQKAFYSAVFGWEVASGGQVQVQAQSPLHGFLRTDPAEKVIYLGVADIKATEVQIKANGGAVLAPRFEVPGQVVLCLFTDPAGNRMGLVEMDGDTAKVP